MRLASKFDEDPALYDKWRPTYVPELYEDMLAYRPIGRSGNVLEIGIGTGQATLPLLKTGCRLTAVEPGGNLAAFSQKKFAGYENFAVQNTTFEDFSAPDSAFDLIYAATAFHWIPEETGYPKVYRLLKSGGAFARFRNHPYMDKGNLPLHAALQEVYAAYMPGGQEPPEYSEKDCVKLADAIKQYGFVDVTYKLYHRVRTFNAKGYVSLLDTYSDHRALQEDRRALFYNKIKEVIGRFGGQIHMYDTINLLLARKP